MELAREPGGAGEDKREVLGASLPTRTRVAAALALSLGGSAVLAGRRVRSSPQELD
jgi:hypothetical protein